MSAVPIEVTDHALLRWMQRTGLADVEPVREVLAESLSRAALAARQIGVPEYLILADGLVYVVRGGVLITVLDDDGRHASALGRPGQRPA